MSNTLTVWQVLDFLDISKDLAESVTSDRVVVRLGADLFLPGVLIVCINLQTREIELQGGGLGNGNRIIEHCKVYERAAALIQGLNLQELSS